MGIVAKELSPQEISEAKQQADAIAHSAKLENHAGQFTFFAAFDGTRNDANDLSIAGSSQTTNVAELVVQVDSQRSTHPNLVAKYYSGPGTADALPHSDIAPTLDVVRTANKAYDEFAREASKWLDSHPGGSVTAMCTAFSRGGATAAIFSQLLYEKGVVDPRNNKIIIPPGQVGLSAALIYDPVSTGIGGTPGITKPNLAFAPNSRNITVTRAENEYRYAFKASDYMGQPGVTVLDMKGNHGDNGGGYDNGLAALTLEAGTRFFKNAGLPISEPDAARKFNASKPVSIHSEGVDNFGNVIWSEYGSVAAKTTRLAESYSTPASTVATPNGSKSVFNAENGSVITSETINENGVVKEQVVTVKRLDGSSNEYRLNAKNRLTTEVHHSKDALNRVVRHEQHEDKHEHETLMLLNKGWESFVKGLLSGDPKAFDKYDYAAQEVVSPFQNSRGVTRDLFGLR